MPETTTKRATSQTVFINPDADKYFAGLAKRTLYIMFGSVIFLTLVMAFAYATPRGAWYYRYLPIMDYVAGALVVIPFFIGTNFLYSERIRIGRELNEKGDHKQAIAALDPFEAKGYRFMDRTGEAHYLLSKSYAAVGAKERSEKCREFVVKNRPGVWANLLKPHGHKAPVRISQLKAQESRPRPSKSKPKRRF